MQHSDLPTGYVTMRELVGAAPISREQAALNAARRLHPMRPRSGRRGLVQMGAPEIWGLIALGKFPAPIQAPSGFAWSLEDVLRWRDAQPK